MLTKTCRQCTTSFEITNEDLEFYDKVSPIFAGKKCLIPAPTLCPDCRQQRRVSFNNETNLYHRKCDYSGEQMISIYSSDKALKVYNQKTWWSDKWDPLSYGKSFDFNRPFFEQFEELLKEMPHAGVHNAYLTDENSTYTNYAGNNKNCYLIFHADLNRDCYYGYGVKKCESSIDVYNLFDSELCYECIDVRNSYNLRYAKNCNNCSDSAFLEDCTGCKNCIGCKNLIQKEYCIFNQQVSKEEYENFLKNNPLSSFKTIQELQNKWNQFRLNFPFREVQKFNSEDSSGDHLFNCFNVKESFDIENLRDGKYCYQIYNGAKDCMDVYQYGLNAELCYESSIIGYNAHSLRFCLECDEQVSDLTYCNQCHYSSQLFGCFGLRHKKYCILNKQYTKEEYEELVPRIIEHMRTPVRVDGDRAPASADGGPKTGEWGEYFPSKISYFGYNETTAQEYFPLTKDEAKMRDLKWHEEEEKGVYQGPKHEIPDDISEISDAFTENVLACSTCSKNYRIIPQELKFYRSNNMPIPRSCQSCRHKDRMALRNPRHLWNRACAKCQSPIQTTFSPEQPESVYCEKCYLEAVY